MSARWIKYNPPRLSIKDITTIDQEPTRPEKIFDEIDNKILRLRLQNKSLRQIAREIGLGHVTVWQRIQRMQRFGIQIA